ncbi:MAG: putative Phenylalanine racemase (ATP-hydrolyzing) [Burkholderiales bacterium]|jgi:surfactin family lipopeptide synthetase A|nr:putative Phenylalanine racemase (ATP-hydrolyzing) [Burkholderiales bacterium]
MSDSARYNMVIDQLFYGKLDIDRLENAVKQYINGYVVVNSHIELVDGEPYWVKNPTISSLEYDSKQITNDEVLSFINKKFNLYTGPLYRFKLICLEEDKYRFIIVFHHLIIDALSANAGLFIALSNYYNDSNYKVEEIDAQIQLLEGLTNSLYQLLEKYKSKYESFWSKTIANMEGVDLKFLNFGKDNIHTNLVEKYNFSEKLRFNFSEEVVNKLTVLKRKYLVTPYFYSQSIFAVLIYLHSHQKNFIIGYPIAIKEGIDFIHGAQVNTCLMPYNFSNNITIIDIFKQSRQFIKSLKQDKLNYNYYPISSIVNESNKFLLNTVFNQANFRHQAFNFEGLKDVQVLDNFNIYLNGYLLFEQELKDNNLYFQVRYDKNIIDQVLLENFIKNYQKLFIEILTDLNEGTDNKQIHEYSVISNEEYYKIAKKLSYCSGNVPPSNTIQQLFEAQVLKTPDNLALIFNDNKLTYRDLNTKANQLAHYLNKKYIIKPNDLIALCLNRSEYMVVSILAVLKAGGAYVPLEITSSKDKIEYILKDTSAALILTDNSVKDYIGGIVKAINARTSNYNINTEIVNSDEVVATLNQQSVTNLTDSNSIKDLAYVMYTSGTSGYPKGVLIPHESCVNRLLEMNRISKLDSESKILFKTNYIFDVSFSDIFTGLTSGACLTITNQSFDIKEIYKKISNNSINVCHFTPSQFDTIKSIYGEKLFSNMQKIFFSGEALDKKLISNLSNQIQCINYYGPTETGEVTAEITIYNTNFENISTIGYRFINTQLFILDDELKPLPCGVIGELYIGGTAIAKGYLNQDKLTKENFIKNPFQTIEEKELNINSKIYKTGDLVRLLPDYNIEYIGRNDRQIKINGCRIEPGEIESRILQYPGIKQVKVLIKSNTSLIAYYVSDNELNEEDMQTYLTNHLSENLLPNAFIRLTSMPLTQNGKLDIGTLPSSEHILKSQYNAPRNKLEEKVCKIYADTLSFKEQEVGIKDDFFKLGGNSLLAIKLLAELQKDFKITINDIFKFRTPEKIVSLPLVKDSLYDKMEQIKQIYERLNYAKFNNNLLLTKDLMDKQTQYLQKIKNINVDGSLQNITNILLTGSTGYLGCNLLQQLLDETRYNIFLLIRADTEKDAYTRISNKFLFYFKKSLDQYKDRLNILASDIEQPTLGLDNLQFQDLIYSIDCIIHCAALVKHYGHYDEFYKANVQSTIHLLELAKLTRNKNFNYVSTVGVLMGAQPPNQENYYFFNENDNIENLTHISNWYIQTKYQAELLTLKYRQYGINSNIYRIGNLGMHSKTYVFQENAKDNMFFNHIKTIMDIKMVPIELSHVEISPVDYTAKAIIQLFNQKNLSNQIYHLFNPNLCNLADFFSAIKGANIQKVSFDNFATRVLDIMNQNDSKHFNLFILYQLWLLEADNVNFARIKIYQDYTSAVLSKFNFRWPLITKEMLKGMIDQTSILL